MKWDKLKLTQKISNPEFFILRQILYVNIFCSILTFSVLIYYILHIAFPSTLTVDAVLYWSSIMFLAFLVSQAKFGILLFSFHYLMYFFYIKLNWWPENKRIKDQEIRSHFKNNISKTILDFFGTKRSFVLLLWFLVIIISRWKLLLNIGTVAYR